MRVTIATGIFPPDIGGPAIYTERLANELKKRNIEVGIITYSDNKKIETDNFPITRIPRSYILPIRYFLYFIKLLSLAKDSDIIYAQDLFSSGLPAALVKRILKNKLIIRLGGDFLWEKAIEKSWSERPLSQYYKQPKNYQEKLFLWISKKVLKTARLIVFSTDWQKKIYFKNYNLKQKKTAVIQNPFPKKILNVKQKNNQKIIFAGRLIKLKNIDFLIKSFSQILVKHKNLQLEIIGEGPKKEYFKKIVSQNQLEKSVTFREKLPHQKLLKEISQCFLVILPSLTEISPNLVLDCIKLKKPVLLTKETGFYERFRNNLIFINPFSQKDLVNKIKYLLDKENYQKYQDQISLISTNYSWPEIVEQHINIFKGLKVLMIGTDRTWFGADYTGDLIERHKEYVKQLGSQFDRLDIIVFSKRGFNKKKFGDNLRAYPTNSLFKIFYVWNAYRIGMKHKDSDLIVCQDPFLSGLTGWLLKIRLKAPLLIHFHGDFWENRYWLIEKKRWWFNWLFLFLSKLLTKRADGIRVVSSGIRNKLIAAGINKKKIRVISTPFKLEKPDLQKVKNFREQHHQNRKTIINVGRQDPSKDYDTLLKAISLVYDKYKNFAFWQVGGHISSVRTSEGLIWSSTGKIEQTELTNYYHASDIYVSSSVHESFGKVLVEAMAAGLPVVATSTTGSKEIIVNGKNGFLVPIGDSQALAKKILYLLNNPEKAKQMGEVGKKIAKNKFDRQKNIKKIVNFWQDLVNRK